ncbi:hypothetical protein [Chryseobacterium sp.]|uniref:hypothetical protein n=1 Tax=Chryseobacterium sp. TaxID=1871047 RepID=UPI0011CC6081|nr:hypothetical protein [Chryseobacterium sp.]TXF79592.1 hypothetical protein FUA25_04200 [Chryseobacterium sp.]
MSRERRLLLITLFIIPVIVSAHGQEALYILFWEGLLVIILLILITALKINLKKKLILAGLSSLSIIATLLIISKISYRGNEFKINLIIFLIPTITFLITFLFLKFKSKRHDEIE